MRVFFAIPLPDQIKTILETAQVPFRLTRQRGNFTSRANFHLTLVFIGEVREDQLDVLEDILEDLELQPFELQLSDLGSFTSKDGSIWWVGIRKNQSLIDLQKTITDALKEEGFTFDEKAFKPHLTLVRNYRPKTELETILLPRIEPASFDVTHVSLMRSHRINDELQYTELFGKDL